MLVGERDLSIWVLSWFEPSNCFLCIYLNVRVYVCVSMYMYRFGHGRA